MSGRMKLSVCLILFCFARPVLAAAPMLDKVDLFEAEKGGYALFRIPGIIITSIWPQSLVSSRASQYAIIVPLAVMTMPGILNSA